MSQRSQGSGSDPVHHRFTSGWIHFDRNWPTRMFSVSLSLFLYGSLRQPTMKLSDRILLYSRFVFFFVLWSILMADVALSIRFPNQISQNHPNDLPNRTLKTAVFALGSFWRSEAVFGCLDGVVRTAVGYAGGSKTNPVFVWLLWKFKSNLGPEKANSSSQLCSFQFSSLVEFNYIPQNLNKYNVVFPYFLPSSLQNI